jgi:hypothetical protein
MASNNQKTKINLTVDRNNLYREESFTDIKVAAIRKLSPVKSDLSPDDTRRPLFMGQTQLMTPSGPVMLQSLLEAITLDEAIEKFPDAMQKEMDKVMAKIHKNPTEKVE